MEKLSYSIPEFQQLTGIRSRTGVYQEINAGRVELAANVRNLRFVEQLDGRRLADQEPSDVVEYLDTQLLGFGELGPGVLTGHDEVTGGCGHVEGHRIRRCPQERGHDESA